MAFLRIRLGKTREDAIKNSKSDSAGIMLFRSKHFFLVLELLKKIRLHIHQAQCALNIAPDVCVTHPQKPYLVSYFFRTDILNFKSLPGLLIVLKARCGGQLFFAGSAKAT
jgi:hypothetical protein